VKGAESQARSALPLFRAAGDRIAEAEALALLGLGEAAAGDPVAALLQFESALSLYTRMGARRGVAAMLHQIGRVRAALGQSSSARGALTKALAIRHDVGLRDDEAETHYELGLAAWKGGAIRKADQHLVAALDLIEEIRGRVAGEYSRATFYAARRKYFAARIDVLMEMHAQDPSAGHAIEAFEVSERERARALVDSLREAGATGTAGADPALLDRRRDLQNQR
jgi:tetratricopeptide (TPR) repeat protein